MKNIFWVFSFFGSFSCFAQNYWSVADSKKSQVADLAFLGDTIVAMSGTINKD